MDKNTEYDLGEQPLKRIMQSKELTSKNLVLSSTDNITFKMIDRACKGRRLTKKVQIKVLDALNKATNANYTLTDIFTY